MRKILLGPTMAGDRRRLGSLLAGRFQRGSVTQITAETPLVVLGLPRTRRPPMRTLSAMSLAS